MDTPELITKITQTLIREDGSQAKIVAQVAFGSGLTRSVDFYVLRRPDASANWMLCSKTPHPDWRTMYVEDYRRFGRSETLQTVTTGEIMRLMGALGKPLNYLDTLERQG